MLESEAEQDSSLEIGQTEGELLLEIKMCQLGELLGLWHHQPLPSNYT